MSSLEGRVMFLSGGSRGIGLAIALRAARDGARVALMAKTAEPHPKLPGTIYTAAEEIEAAGGEALPIVGDIRDAEGVEAAVAQTVERFGGIDTVVNNASAINLAPMRDLPVKRFDLMQQINSRGTFVVTRACLPHLRESSHAHVLTLSPPLSADPRWLAGHSAYTLSKMGMTMITLGLAADEAEAGIGANCLWPRTIIATAAVQNLLGGDEARPHARDRGRRRPRHPAAGPALLHRERVHRRRGAGRGGHHGPGPLLRCGGHRLVARHLRGRVAGGRAGLSHVVLLSGGTGGAKLARGLLEVCDQLTVVANTGDDVEVHGVHVSPDPDLVTYWLADEIDPRGWGLRRDTSSVMDALRDAGRPVWFHLGDRDLAMCLVRTALLREGRRLTEAHAAVVSAMGVSARVLPMSDQPVATFVRHAGRLWPFQEYMIVADAAPPVEGVALQGLERARPTDEVLSALAFCEWAGIETSAAGIAGAYAAVVDGLVADEVVNGVPCLVTETLMGDEEARRRVASDVLEFGVGL